MSSVLEYAERKKIYASVLPRMSLQKLYQLSNGQTVDKEEGVALAKQGGIQGVGVSERYGNEYLKSVPDGTESNNLSNLPSVSSSTTGMQ